MRSNSFRFNWLDIIRGIASLSVVLWHWQHFFYDGALTDISINEVVKTQYPLYGLLWPFYEYGSRAVELFFTLSGFIFFWLYADKIAKRKISLNDYLVLRLSRLYPLHLLTLGVVVIGQLAFHYVKDAYFVYDDHSLKSFLTNLTLTHRWFSSDYTFNGPVWSVSVELSLYILFFICCTLGLKNPKQIVFLILMGWLLRNTRFDSIGQGIMCFFAGGIAYYSFNWLMQHVDKQKRLLFTLTLPLVILGAIVLYFGATVELPAYFYELILFPLLIITVALLEATLGVGIGRHFVSIGHISYSSYLWHFPLQLGFAIGAELFGLERSVFYSPFTLGLFYSILLLVSHMSYHYFEMPAQVYLRKQWSSYQPTRFASKSV